MTLTPIHTLSDVAAAMGVTTRFLRDYVNTNHVEHMRVGNGPNARIKFTEAQYEALQQLFVKQPVAESITTGRRRRSA